jgi:hypothetical protein
MYKRFHLKTLLTFFCCASLILIGCSAKEAVSTSSDPSNAQFDKLTRKMFIDYVENDTLTINYTLKNPSVYGIDPGEVTWGDIPVTKEDFEDCKEDTKNYAGI